MPSFIIIDSLKQQLAYAREDTNKLVLLNRIYIMVIPGLMLIQVLCMQNRRMELAQKLNYEQGMLSAQRQMMLVH